MPLSLLLIVLAVAPAFAQTGTGQVRGRVVDARGNEPMARVQVQLAGTSQRTVTDADGSFKLPPVAPGEYVLHVATVGYHLIRQKFSIGAGETKEFEVVLTPSSFRRSESVDVKAEPFDLTRQESAAVLTLDGNEEKNLSSVLADDPLRAVQGLPGVTSNNDFTAEFSLRGASFDRIGLYLDGILLHSPFHMVEGQQQHGSLTAFNGDMLDQMTLYEGAWPVKYSDRTAGMLSINTREGNRKQVQGRVMGGVANAGGLAEGPLGSGKHGSWLVAFRKSYLQYLLNRMDFGSNEPALAFGFIDGQARLNYDLTPKNTVTLSVLDGYSSLDRTSGRQRLGGNSAMTSGFRFTMLNLADRYTPSQGFLVTNRLAWTRERGDVENRDFSSLGADGYGEWVWHTDATWIWHKANTLDFGGSFRRLRDDGYSNTYTYNPNTVRFLDRFRGTGQRTGAYAQQSFALLSGRIHMTAGVRWDKHSVSPVEVASPYASLAVQPFAATRVQFDWGQYAQFPELSQYFSIFGRRSLLPERATHYEATLDQRLDERTRVRLEFYNRQDRDLIARPEFDARILLNGKLFNPPVNAPILNSQRGYSRGMQVFLQRRTANGFTGWVSYAYGRTELRDGVLKLGFPSDWDQRHTVNIFGSYRLKPTVNLSGRYSYGSGFPIPQFFRMAGTNYFLTTNRDGVRIDPYHRVDLRINKAFVYDKRKLTLFAEVVNLTNRKNRIFDGPGSYNTRTFQTYPYFISLFPILPSAGIQFEF